MLIYLVTNIINGKQYVGQTQNSASVRWSQHKHQALKKDSSSVLAAAIRKYGPENFKVSILKTCASIEELNVSEIGLISSLNSLAPHGYNLDSGGSNKIMHESTKQKLSAAKLGKSNGPFSKEHRDAISKALKKAGVRPPNTLEIINKRKLLGPDNGMYGKSHTAAARKKMSQANVGNKYWVGKTHTRQSKDKISTSKDKYKKKIVCLNNGVVYDSIRAAAKAFGISKTSVSWCASGKMVSAKNLRFSFVVQK